MNEIAHKIADERYAWPGGYELYGITDDGGVICSICCQTEVERIDTAYEGDGWNVVSMGCTAEDDEEVTCDHCYRVLINPEDSI